MVENWKDIPGYEGIYQASDLGRIRSMDRYVVYSNGRNRIHRGKILNTKKQDFGYRCLSLCKNGSELHYNVHRLIAMTFVKNENGYPNVLHINDIPDDNRAENLIWGTQKQNIELASKKGRMSSGDNHYMRKIPISDRPGTRLMLDTETGIFYDSIKEAAIAKGYKIKWLQDHLYRFEHRNLKNKTPLIFA